MTEFREDYLGQNICLSEQECTYLFIKNRYRNMGIAASDMFMPKFEAYKDFRTFAANCVNDGFAILKPLLQKMVDELIQSGHYDLSIELILSNYGESIFADWFAVGNAIEEICEKSDIQIKEAEEYRKLRKASRGRMIGGGFGLGGALKGAATAGAFNLFTGALHSGANAIGNSFTRIAQERELNQIYNSQELRNSIQRALQNCVENMGLLKLHYQGINPTDFSISSPEAKQRVEALQQNLPRIPEEQKLSSVVNMLLLDPTNLSTYELLLTMYHDENGTLFRMAKAVGISEDEYRGVLMTACGLEVGDIYNGLEQEVKSITYHDLKDTEGLHVKMEALRKEYRKKIEAMSGEYPCGEISSLLVMYSNQVDSRIQQYVRTLRDQEVKARTYNGIVFSSPEEAEQAKDILARINDLCKRAEGKSIDEIKRFLDELKELQNKAPKEIQDEISTAVKKVEEQYRKLDAEERTYMGKTFSTIEEKEQAQRDYEQLCALQPLSSVTQEKLTKARDNLKRQKWNQFAVERYSAELAKAEKIVAYQQRKKVRSGVDIVCSIILLLFSLTQKLFVFCGVPVELVDVFGVVLSGGKDFPGTSIFIFALVFSAVFILLCVEIVWVPISKEEVPSTFAWGAMFLIALIVCGLAGAEVDATLAFKVVTAIATLGGYILCEGNE